MDLQLGGKVALVTGSSRGIGRAIAEAFAREGASVCLCARSQTELLQAQESLNRYKVRTAAVVADVTRQEEARRAVEFSVSELGRLDILVNNVGGSRGSGAFDQIDAMKWNEVMTLNVTTAALCSWPTVEWMKEHGGGVILNISSIFGREYATSAAYTAAKAALTALTKEMAVDLAKYQIRVNSVAPGSIHFPGGSWDKRQQQDPDAVSKMVEEQLPWKRFGKPEEVAQAVVFLCSARASWISGVSLPVDGAQGRAF